MHDYGAQGDKPADFANAKNELADAVGKGKEAATEALHDARDELTAKASSYVEEAKEALTEKAESAQNNISANLMAFGGALRAASDHLANSDQRGASKFVLETAGTLERLSSSLKDKPFADVLDELRSFGRNNSGAMIAGSVLAGLALGRFLKSPPTGEANRAPKQPAHSTSQPNSFAGGTSSGESSSGWADTRMEPNNE